MSDLRIPGQTAPVLDAAHQKLRTAAHQFEGVFLEQLFKEMRSSVEQESTDAGPGQQMFAGMFDEAMAMEAGKRSTHGLGDALYRQLAARLDSVKGSEGTK
jgi:flagellar protein FlgJ